jgi:cytochrome P450
MGTVVDLMDDANGDAAGSVVDALMTTSTAGGALTDLEVVLNCENIVGASENAGLSLAAGVQAFVEHPDQWASLTEDRSRLNGAVEEIFRWASSATHSMRTATRTIELGSATIHEGDLVVVWLPSANRDNAVFHEPDRFQIGRPSARHLAFGAGEHHCVGRGLATSLAHILFGELIDRVKEIELCEDITPVRSIVVNGPERLPVRLVPR